MEFDENGNPLDPVAGMPAAEAGQLDMATALGLVPPGPPSPTPLAPVPEDALAEAPALVPTETGSVTKTTTKSVESEQSKLLAEQRRQNRGDQDLLTADAATAAQAQGDIDGKKAKEKADSDYQVNQAYAISLKEGYESAQADMAQHKQRSAELANMKPESFWGSKSASDRFAAALSIGLGSFGQAMTGSGRNVGQLLLQRQMDEHQKQQDQRFEAKAKEIDSLKISADQKIRMLDDLTKMKDAAISARHSKIDATYAQMEHSAKTAGVIAKIKMDRAKNAEQAFQFESNLAQQREAKVAEAATERTIQMVSAANSPETIKANKDVVQKLLTDNANIAKVRNQLAEAIRQIRDPNVPLERKIGIGNDILKAANSSLGPDVVGAEEAARGASELKSSVGPVMRDIAKYGGIGGGAGMAVGAPIAGVGAVPGAIGGAILGGVAGLTSALSEEVNKPGGARISPDPEAFAQRLELTLSRMDGSISNNDALASLMKRGLTQSQAQAIINNKSKK